MQLSDHRRQVALNLSRHKLRTVLTAFGVFWGVFMVILLLGIGKGLERGIFEIFKDDAYNSVWISGGKAAIPYQGLTPGRTIKLTIDDLQSLSKALAGIGHLTPRKQLPGDRPVTFGARLSHLWAKQDFERIETLVKRNAAAREEYEKLWTELRLAEQRLTTARRHLEIVQTGASAPLGRSASEVRATISGMVLERPVEIGTFVIETNTFNEGTTVVAIADTSDLIFRGKVDEPEAGSLHVGMPVSVVLGAFPGERFEGRLEFIAPKAVEKDGITTFEIRAGLALKADRLVRAGYSATADIAVAQREEVLALPERYVRFQDGRPYVMLEAAPGRFEQRTITLGLSDGITTQRPPPAQRPTYSIALKPAAQ